MSKMHCIHVQKFKKCIQACNFEKKIHKWIAKEKMEALNKTIPMVQSGVVLVGICQFDTS